MSSWVIFDKPQLLILLGISLFLCLFDREKRPGGGHFCLLGGVLGVLGVGLSLLYGAGLRESASILLVFLLVTLREKTHEL